MLKRYSKLAHIKAVKNDVKNETLNAILNYSKSLQVEQVLTEKVLITLN